MKKIYEERKISSVLARAIDRYNIFIQRSYKIGDCYTPPSKLGKAVRAGHYGFVPYDTLHITDGLSAIYHKIDKPRPTFLDIGCGIGNITQIANYIGFEAHGLEYNTRIYNIALKLTSRYECTIIKGNMLKFERYHKYDVLYYYEPIGNGNLMIKFAEKLAREMKLGAYVIPQGTRRPFLARKFFQHVAGITNHDIYEKIHMIPKGEKNVY